MFIAMFGGKEGVDNVWIGVRGKETPSELAVEEPSDWTIEFL